MIPGGGKGERVSNNFNPWIKACISAANGWWTASLFAYAITSVPVRSLMIPPIPAVEFA